MKKLFMFLAVAGLATFGVSCSSSDDSGDDNNNNNKKTLSLTASSNSVKEGESVTFTVKVGDKEETGAEFYIGADKISSPHTFDTAGEYKVVAKKEGFKDSNVVTVKVTKEGGVDPDPETLVLKAAPATVSVGGTVNFTVQAGGQFINDAVIKLNGETVSNPWTATEAGTFKFTASKEGYENSNEVTVTVEEVVVPEGNFIQVGNDTYNLEDAELGIFTNSEGTPILYTAGEGADAFNYIVYRMYGNVEGTEGADFGVVTMIVVMPEGATQIVWPQDAPEENVMILNSAAVVGGNVIGQTGENEEFLAGFGWGAKPGENTPGQVAFSVTAEEFSMEYEGEYTGLWAYVQQGGATATKSKMTKMTKTAKAKTSLAK